MSKDVTVEIEMGDKIYALRPKLGVMRAVSRLQGGFVGVLRKINDRDYDTMANIICLGTGATSKAATEEAEEAIFAHGIDELVKPLTRYVLVLMNGGRDPDLKTAKVDADEAPAGKN